MRWQHQHRDVTRREPMVYEPIEKEGPSLPEPDSNDPIAPLLPDSSHNGSLEPSARLEAREPVYTSPGNTYGTGSTSGGQNGDSNSGSGSGTSSGSSSTSTCQPGATCSQSSGASTNALPIVLGVV